MHLDRNINGTKDSKMLETNESCVTRAEFPFSAPTQTFIKKKTGNFKDVVTLILYQQSSKWLEISVGKMRCNLSGH